MNNDEDYMLNCVKENLSRNSKDITTEEQAVDHCGQIYRADPEYFNYYRGFVPELTNAIITIVWSEKKILDSRLIMK